MPGRIPKRSDELLGHSPTRAIPVVKLDLADIIAQEVEIPVANEKWHVVALQIWESLTESAQSVYYEPSDWAVAYLMCESLSRDLKPQVVGVNEETGQPVMAKIPLKGASLSAYIKMMTNLLVTEVDRRRAGVEIVRAQHQSTPEELDDNVTKLDDYRDNLTG